LHEETEGLEEAMERLDLPLFEFVSLFFSFFSKPDIILLRRGLRAGRRYRNGRNWDSLLGTESDSHWR
jgi:hypothetical protein